MSKSITHAERSAHHRHRSSVQPIVSPHPHPHPPLSSTTRPFHPNTSQQPKIYIKPTGPDLVNAKVPSCTDVPLGWNNKHDRFIAYLATHAPLDKNGKVPVDEEFRERYKAHDIARLVMETFPGLGSHRLKASVIETRLMLLDQADNDYFRLPYGVYTSWEWGRGI
ncbi:hypothetical protein B7494_g6529 [Chlorociboria aeruginascens]|nr:hypothetical protein B7494_g6529 [Chlorociboria aeruginascens]